MSLTQQIEQALNSPFDAAAQGLNPSEYFGLGVWHNGPTLEESWIKISRELNTETGTFKNNVWIPDIDPTAQTDIDILDKRGTGKGQLKDINELKAKFNKLRSSLPPGEYHLNADDPRKAKLYKREWLKEKNFRLSGETAQGRYTNKKGEIVKEQFETMVMRVHPKDAVVDKNGLRDPLAEDIEQGLPKSKQDAVDRGLNVYEDANGKSWKLRYKSRKKGESFNNSEYKFEREGWESWQAGKRRHHHKARSNWKESLLTKQDYLDYAAENNIPESVALEKYNKNQLRLKSKQLRSGKGTPWIYEHLNPQANPDSVEHWRNNVLWTEEVNAPKSDIIPSDDALRRAGVPLNKREALALDFANDPGVPPKKARSIILEDIQNQIDTKSVTRARNLRAIGRGAKSLSGADAAVRLASGDVIGGSLGLVMQTPAFQKAIAKTLAKSGAKLAPGVGVGLSSLEAAGYASQGRWTQSGIAALSGVVGEVPLVGDLVSAGLDLANTGIDIATGNIKPDIDEDFNYRQIGRTKPRF